ncbi:sulfite exporter TauE/SafE family protein [bacterium]|nr:sulfite exporter TauE/SafE family protein [bacterium]MBU1920207.1 sulfite exporter TauE/SafE family protein [bacterium]
MTGAEFTALAIGALIASTVSGVAGVGGGMIYLPVLVEIVGPQLAVPYLTVLLLAGNFSRFWFARKHVDWKVLGHLALGAVPGAALGALCFTILPAFWITKILGVYLLAYVILNFTRMQWPKRATLQSMTVMGIPAGFSSGIVGGSGLIMAPFFLKYGLVKEAFLSTEALAAASTHIMKIFVWSGASIIGLNDLKLLAPLAVLMIVGTYVAKLLITRMRVQVFKVILLVMLSLVGIRFLFY